MASRNKPSEKDDNTTDHGRYWRPPEERDRITPEGRKWLEENAEAAKAWAEWVEKNGVPLRPLF